MSGTYQFGAGFMPQKPHATPQPDRMLNIEPVHLFPTRIWQSRLDSLKARYPAWIEAVEAMRAAQPVPAGRSNRQGWNSAEKTLFDDRAENQATDASETIDSNFCSHKYYLDAEEFFTTAQVVSTAKIVLKIRAELW